MPKVIGDIVGVPNPKSDWNQTDETKADYIKNKPDIYTRKEVDEKIKDINVGGGGGSAPVKGVDYWTPEDIAEIKSYVDDAILGGEW
jgi:hypothetical protein